MVFLGAFVSPGEIQLSRSKWLLDTIDYFICAWFVRRPADLGLSDVVA
jgi:hypothetical protein